MIRSHAEMYKRMSTIEDIPCPDCGMYLPAWKDDDEARQEHYATCAYRKSAPLLVDDEFQALIPALTVEESTALEQSLLAEGCRDALVVWPHDGRLVLVDGHNRYRLCQQHHIPFMVKERAFESREDVVVWMVRNQMARRNLTDFARAELVLKMTSVINALKAKARANESAGGGDRKNGKTGSGLTNLSNPINTRAELSAIAEVSEGTLSKVQRVVKDAPDFIKEKARSGALSTHRAEELTKSLSGAAPEVLEVVERFDVEDTGTITLLSHLHKKGRDTFNEVAASGTVQINDEADAVPITAPSAIVYKAVEQKADLHRQLAGLASGVPAALLSSESNEWYTPHVYIQAVREVLGGSIDLDPASTSEANQTVQAARYFDVMSNGLSRVWDGTVFLNPPYGRAEGESLSNQALWSARLIEQYAAGKTTAAVLLVNAITDAGWFQALWDYPICFTHHRIPFQRPSGAAGVQPVRGSAFIYFGPNVVRFADVFRRFGAIVLSAVKGDAS